jgi:hypothetical protein
MTDQDPQAPQNIAPTEEGDVEGHGKYTRQAIPSDQDDGSTNLRLHGDEDDVEGHRW